MSIENELHHELNPLKFTNAWRRSSCRVDLFSAFLADRLYKVDLGK